jgi:hypothetical protein
MLLWTQSEHTVRAAVNSARRKGLSPLAGEPALLWHPAARGAFVAVTCVSLVLSLLALWAAAIGVIVNVVLLALVWKSSPRLFPARA